MPHPIRSDTSNAFAHRSMRERVPRILDEVLERNRDYAAPLKDAVRTLRDSIAAGERLPPLESPAPDAVFWLGGLLARTGEGWLSSDWFFVECYAYRCLLGAVRYFETGRDPFAPAKDEELLSSGLGDAVARTLDEAASLAEDERVHHLLGAVLWGNRIDLSYSVGTMFGARGESEDLLADDRALAVPRLLDPPGDVHVVLDNAGGELAMDLLLVDALLWLSPCRVVLHAKMHPTFVSDATPSDVWALLSTLKGVPGVVREMAHRLEAAFWASRLRVVPDFFWNSPLFWVDRPRHLGLDDAGLVIAKGDANYRRLVGDAIWPDGSTFDEAVGVSSAPVLCLRTLKSDCLVGVSNERALALDRDDPAWRINSRRGVIQATARWAGAAARP